MSYKIKQILLAIGLLIVYWGALFNYKEVTETTLQILGSWYVGSIMYRIIVWLVPKENASEQKN